MVTAKTATKQAPAATNKRVRNRSVVKTVPYEQAPSGGLVLSLASIADDFPLWGADPVGLDWKLREFWPTESYLQSAIFAVATRNAAFSWTLKGPEQTVEACREMLIANWVDICYRWNIDYMTQCNGAFMEIIRDGESPEAACIGINHLDAGRCRRTGVPEWPVIYSDIYGQEHRLAPHQVAIMSDMPSPVETMNGVGMCGVYRVLCEAKRMRDISIHDREKLAGHNPKGLYIIGNVGQKQLTDVLKQHTEMQMQKGYMRYVKPAVMGVLDPAKPASVERVDFASLPDGFDKDKELTWYVTVMALALGCDYQDLAPLSSGSLGTSTQSQVLHLKSKGKGPAMYMKRFAHMMNYSGILPRNVEFEWDEQDIEDDLEQEELAQRKAQRRGTYVTIGVLTPKAVRQEMLEDGEISQEVFDALAVEDETRQATEAEERQARIAQMLGRAIQGDEDSPDGDVEGAGVGDEDEEAVAAKGGEGSGHFGHAGRPGEVGGGQPGPGGGAGHSRSQRAKLSYKPATKRVQSIGDGYQRRLAKSLKNADETMDNAPFDVIVGGKHAIEVKTIVRGSNDKITMHPESLERKLKEARRNQYTAHTVVFDHRSKTIYYKKGVGSFRLKNMTQVSIEDLERKLK